MLSKSEAWATMQDQLDFEELIESLREFDDAQHLINPYELKGGMTLVFYQLIINEQGLWRVSDIGIYCLECAYKAGYL